jgi:hypothetical protein
LILEEKPRCVDEKRAGYTLQDDDFSVRFFYDSDVLVVCVYLHFFLRKVVFLIGKRNGPKVLKIVRVWNELEPIEVLLVGQYVVRLTNSTKIACINQ